MDTPSLTPFLLFLVGSKPRMYAALCCIYKKHSIRIRKTKIFSLLNSEPQKTKQKKNGRLSRAVRSVELQKIMKRKLKKQIAILYYL